MTGDTATLGADAPPLFRVGRPFIHPAFDLLVIGSVASLVMTPLLLADGGANPLARRLDAALPLLVLLCNSAHFAASTVRLYAKPHAIEHFPLLTAGFPLLTLLVLTISIVFAAQLGAGLQTLYLTWSPYHYGAQAYGLTLIYAYRSGCTLADLDKKLLRLACLLPFLAAVVGGRTLLGLSYVPERMLLTKALGIVTIALPILVFARLAARREATLPLMSLAVLASNAVWLITLNEAGAFAWATIFHGLQYLAIVAIFHVKDQLARPHNARGWVSHTALFYLACLTLGYLLFQVWPFAYVLLGFGVAESMLMVAAVINLHHFIVDGYIWKLRQAPNYGIVSAA